MKWALYPLGRNPMELVEIKDVTKREKQPRVLRYDEFWTLLTFVDEPYRTMVLVAQCLGLRISEVMALQWSDFDFDNLTVRVQRGIVRGRVDVVKTEYSNDDLPLDSDLCAILKHWKNQCPVSPDGWVFSNPTTLKPYWQENVCVDHIKPAALKAGLGTNIGWHTFRHTYLVGFDGSADRHAARANAACFHRDNHERVRSGGDVGCEASGEQQGSSDGPEVGAVHKSKERSL